MWGFIGTCTCTSSRPVPVKAAGLLSQANGSQLGHRDGGKKGRQRVRRVGEAQGAVTHTCCARAASVWTLSWALHWPGGGGVDRCWGFFSCLHALKPSQTAWKHKQDVTLSPLQGRILDAVPTEAQWGCFKACTQLCPIYWCSQSHCGGQAA